MKYILIALLLSNSVYAEEYDNDGYTEQQNRYSSCVSWCSTRTLMTSCSYASDREDKYLCEKQKKEDYYFCERQCNDQHKR